MTWPCGKNCRNVRGVLHRKWFLNLWKPSKFDKLEYCSHTFVQLHVPPGSSRNSQEKVTCEFRGAGVDLSLQSKMLHKKMGSMAWARELPMLAWLMRTHQRVSHKRDPGRVVWVRTIFGFRFSWSDRCASVFSGGLTRAQENFLDLQINPKIISGRFPKQTQPHKANICRFHKVWSSFQLTPLRNDLRDLEAGTCSRSKKDSESNRKHPLMPWWCSRLSSSPCTWSLPGVSASRLISQVRNHRVRKCSSGHSVRKT